MAQLDLHQGLRVADRTGRKILYRYVTPADDIDAITEMLHESYAPLAQQGLRFLATHQDADTTRRRMSWGETILALDVAMLALDTSEHAAHLIALYQSKGYAFVEHIQWRDVNYRSMIFAKRLC